MIFVSVTPNKPVIDLVTDSDQEKVKFFLDKQKETYIARMDSTLGYGLG